jgi:hypothetical protein
MKRRLPINIQQYNSNTKGIITAAKATTATSTTTQIRP